MSQKTIIAKNSATNIKHNVKYTIWTSRIEILLKYAKTYEVLVNFIQEEWKRHPYCYQNTSTILLLWRRNTPEKAYSRPLRDKGKQMLQTTSQEHT